MEYIELTNNKVYVIRKNIKHLYLKIKRASGEVQVIAPSELSDEKVVEFVKAKEPWILTHTKMADQVTQIRTYQVRDGKEIDFFQKQIQVKYNYVDKFPQYYLFKGKTLNLYIKQDCSQEKIQELVDAWYREELAKQVDLYAEKWLAIMGVEIDRIRIKKMKTRWGTCNPSKRTIWINFELVKMPQEFLEYVLVHELVHLFERGHGPGFKSKLTEYYPSWQALEGKMDKYAII